ncbi:hypothetical protein [Nannocystis pusilla]|uniref:hypothetical protein n=1 Tax=Nannocystis pusilla TaxID=889268 RepID=UPI003B770A6E
MLAGSQLDADCVALGGLFDGAGLEGLLGGFAAGGLRGAFAGFEGEAGLASLELGEAVGAVLLARGLGSLAVLVARGAGGRGGAEDGLVVLLLGAGSGDVGPPARVLGRLDLLVALFARLQAALGEGGDERLVGLLVGRAEFAGQLGVLLAGGQRGGRAGEVAGARVDLGLGGLLFGEQRGGGLLAVGLVGRGVPRCELDALLVGRLGGESARLAADS